MKISFGIKIDCFNGFAKSRAESLLSSTRHLVCISHLFIRVLMGQLTATRQHDLRVIYD